MSWPFQARQAWLSSLRLPAATQFQVVFQVVACIEAPRIQNWKPGHTKHVCNEWQTFSQHNYRSTFYHLLYYSEIDITLPEILGSNLILTRHGYSSHAATIARPSHHEWHNCSHGGYLKQEWPFLHNFVLHSLHCGTKCTARTRHHNQTNQELK